MKKKIVMIVLIVFNLFFLFFQFFDKSCSIKILNMEREFYPFSLVAEHKNQVDVAKQTSFTATNPDTDISVSVIVNDFILISMFAGNLELCSGVSILSLKEV